MPVTIERLIMTMVILACSASGIALIARLFLFQRLRRRHRALWQDLGRPHWFGDPTQRTHRGVVDLLWNQERRPSNDLPLEWLVTVFQAASLFAVSSIFIIFPVLSGDILVSRLDPTTAPQYASTLWILVGVIWLLTGFGSAAFCRFLEHRQPAKWEELGKPSYFAYHQKRIHRFLWSGEHRAIDDSRLHLFVFIIRGLTLAAVFLFVLAVSVNKMIGTNPSL
jgi:hypothetical protein